MDTYGVIGTGVESPFSTLYKCSGKNLEMSQQQRREMLLIEQKQKRHEIIDKQRQAYEKFVQDAHVQEKMDCDTTKTIKSKKLQFELMESEWFTEIPDDLEENWLVKNCPQGLRVLLVAERNSTLCYNKKGNVILGMATNFPGGRHRITGTTVLDCIFNKATQSIFVLDVLFWNSLPMIDTEASFRFFWLKSKFHENPNFSLYLKYTFILLDHMPAQRSLIQNEMFKGLLVKNTRLCYNGIVFYHKESHYTFGCTPLVGWLASFMLPEKLHIDVAPGNMVNKPKDYICMETYLEDRKNKKNSVRRETGVEESEMDVQ